MQTFTNIQFNFDYIEIYTWKSLTINQAEQAFTDCVYEAAGLIVWAL